MFDIGFLELLLIGILSLLIMGPERLPTAVRNTTVFLARMRRKFDQIKSDVAQEVGADDIKQEIHNESMMESLAKTRSDLQDSFQAAADELQPDPDIPQYNVENTIKADVDKKNTDDNSQV